MQKKFDFDKLFGAVLMAMLIAALAGFVSRELIEVKYPEKKGFVIAGAAPAGSGTETTQAAAAEAEPVDAMLGSADVAAGEKITRVCASCHDFTKGGPNKIGPNLYGVVGRPRAAHEGFNYSDAFKTLQGKNWTTEELNKYLFNPKQYIPGNKMAFAGLPKTQDRANLIAYLKTLSGN